MESITPKIRAFIAACESAGLGAVSVNISIQELKQLLAENQPGVPPEVLQEFNAVCAFLLGEGAMPGTELHFGDIEPGPGKVRRAYWWRKPLRILVKRMNGEG